MGAVYLAARDDAEYRGRVAIKIVRAGLATPAAIARFRDYRQVLARLAQPCIVRLLDGGRTEDGLPYLVMEHVEGVSLKAHARTLSVRARVELVIRIAEALQYAHQQLVVHRDVKPSNVLVEASGAPKLLDFGIAKLLEPGAARESVTRTAASRSRSSIKPRAGAWRTRFGRDRRLLARRGPVRPAGRAPTAARWRDAARDSREHLRPRPAATQPDRARCIATRARGDLDNILSKALQKQPERRYASAARSPMICIATSPACRSLRAMPPSRTARASC
jgi:hypothetical protein